jgi:hypothetical protein
MLSSAHESPPHHLPPLTQGVRQKNFNRVKQQIAGSLFQAKPTFVKHLSDIMAAADEVRTINFSYANPNHLYNLHEYSELQVCVCVCACQFTIPRVPGRCIQGEICTGPESTIPD